MYEKLAKTLRKKNVLINEVKLRITIITLQTNEDGCYPAAINIRIVIPEMIIIESL